MFVSAAGRACLAALLGLLWTSAVGAEPVDPPARIYEGRIGSYPIVARILIAPYGDVNGHYYYAKKQPVALMVVTGTRKGDAIALQESPSDNSGHGLGEISGRFACTVRGPKIEGQWLSNDGQKQYGVALNEVSPGKRQSKLRETILDAVDRLNLPSPDCDQESSEEPDEYGCGPLQCSIRYGWKNDDIRSFVLWRSNPCGVYPNVEQGYSTYDPQTSRGIVLWDEIDPGKKSAFTAFVREEGRKMLTAWRGRGSDEEWYYLLGGSDAEPRGNDASTDVAANRRKFVDEVYAKLDPVEILAEFHVAEDGVHLGRCGLWNLPHLAAALDFCDDLVIGPRQMATYLKSNSLLRKLAVRKAARH